MALPFSTLSNKAFGWITAGLLLIYAAAIIPAVLAMDSRIVFFVAVLVFILWCILLAVRLLGGISKTLGWSILISLAAVLGLSLFTSRAMPFAYFLLLFLLLASVKLIRSSQSPGKPIP